MGELSYGRWVEVRLKGPWEEPGDPPTPMPAWLVSKEVNLGQGFEFLQVIIPALDTCTINLQVSEDANRQYQSFGEGQNTGETSGEYSTVFLLGGYQYVRLELSVAQATDRIFKVRGMNK